MQLNWAEKAKFELRDAAQYYNEQEAGLEMEFIDAVGSCVRRIIKNPEIPRQFDPPYRKMNTERFPYQVIYSIEGNTVLISSVVHQSRKPGSWKT